VKYTLSPSERNKTLPPGKYLVHVEGADGLKSHTDEFTLSKRGKETVRVIVDPQWRPPASMTDAQRKALEWVLANGGSLTVVSSGEMQTVPAHGQLPAGRFAVKDVINLNLQGTGVGDADLTQLEPLQGLERLELLGTKVTAAGIAHLRGFKRLKWLTLADLPL